MDQSGMILRAAGFMPVTSQTSKAWPQINPPLNGKDAGNIQQNENK